MIVNLQFFPQKDSLKIVSAAEDMCVKVWDMVLSSEIATIKGATGRITSLQFTNDFKTLIVACLDGSFRLFNANKRFELLHSQKNVYSDSNQKDEEETEITSLAYISYSAESSFLAIGSQDGRLALFDLSKLEVCFVDEDPI